MSDSIPALLERRANADPDRLFVTEVKGRQATYGEFQRESMRWAAALRGIGVAEGDTVSSMLVPCIEAFACWIGTSWLRAIDAPVNTDFRGRMLEYILAQSGAKILVCDGRFLDRLEQIDIAATSLEAIVVVGDRVPATVSLPIHDAAQLVSGAEPLTGEVAPRNRDIACMIYTSGTTGPSKGVLIPWGQQMAFATGTIPQEDVSDDDVFYSGFPMFHGSGRIALVLMTLGGGRFVIREQFSGSEFWNDVRTYGCTTSAFVGAMPLFLWNLDARDDDADNPLRRAIMLPVIPQYRDFEERFGVKLRTCYSMTEISPPCGTSWDIPNNRTCGTLRDGYDVRLVDPDDNEVAVGEVGEMIVRTDEPWTMNAGYFNMPEATVDLWRNGWVHTGDAFRVDKDGNYYFVDRFKDAIRRRGENISSFEVEAHVNSHPGVAESAAIAVPSEFNEDEVMVVVVRAPEGTVDAEELVRFLIPVMPRFMVPRYVRFVDALPKTDATMRTKKVELREAGITSDTWDREAAGIEVPR